MMGYEKMASDDLLVGTGPPYEDYLVGPRKPDGKPLSKGFEINGAPIIEQSHEFVMSKQSKTDAPNQ